jgi:two-component system, OmpR family, response regulator VicR
MYEAFIWGETMNYRLCILRDEESPVYDTQNPLFENFEVTTLEPSLQAIKHVFETPFDACVLCGLKHDLELELATNIRNSSLMPLISYHPDRTDEERIISYQSGVDIAISWAMSNVEIELLMTSFLKRKQKIFELPKKFTFQHLTVDTLKMKVYQSGKELHLTAKEYDLLLLLLKHPEQTFKKREIFKRIWQTHHYFSQNVLNVHVRHLREKIEIDPSAPTIIMTTWGFGYHLGEGVIQPII